MGKVKGFESALEALRGVDSATRERILKDMIAMDPKMAEKLKSGLINFDDLLAINPQGFLRLCQDVPDAKWVMALRGKTSDFVDQLLKPLAERRSALIKAAISQLGPQPLSKVETAQREVIAKALGLEEQGLLIFKKGKDSFV